MLQKFLIGRKTFSIFPNKILNQNETEVLLAKWQFSRNFQKAAIKLKGNLSSDQELQRNANK